MIVPETPTGPSPWHEGERAVQARAGVPEERIERIGRHNIRSFVPDEHRAFFAQLPFLIIGSVDRAGWPWASVLSGPPGFAASPDPHRLHIAARPVEGDPLAEALEPGAPLGLLGIELPTRRRNRMNGRILALDSTGFSVAVDQSFGNCPQYIHPREFVEALAHNRAAPRAENFTALDEAARDLITRTDTAFVASVAREDGPAASHGVDVSHRGGPVGFLRIATDGAIVVPDYRGNRFFNTLGNLMVNPRAGLLVVDFEKGDLLQVTGTTEIVWEGAEVQAAEGAERIWRLTPSHGQWLRGALPLRMTLH
jgi:predicted pyridoxine 5'-phosphate oxidase superfamily flavin-nucleotide-binding protein